MSYSVIIEAVLRMKLFFMRMSEAKEHENLVSFVGIASMMGVCPPFNAKCWLWFKGATPRIDVNSPKH